MTITQQIEQVREFNRFYTRLIGLLNEGLFKSKFTLTEARIIYELGEIENLLASDLRHLLGLDAGYLSRVLSSLVKRNIIEKNSNQQDKRQLLLSLTKNGDAERLDLRERSIGDIKALFENMGDMKTANMVKAMNQIVSAVDAPKAARSYLLRAPEVGDLSYITHRQSVLYNLEYGFDESYEAVVSSVIGEYIRDYNHQREKCWIAEYEDQIVGSIFCVDGGNDVAKLRLLYVDPVARGMGIGGKLVTEVIKFARKKNYQKIEFWTVDCLTTAQYLYEQAGFELHSVQPHTDFGTNLNAGKGLMRQNWQMIL